jgi:hypothetical protein
MRQAVNMRQDMPRGWSTATWRVLLAAALAIVPVARAAEPPSQQASDKATSTTTKTPATPTPSRYKPDRFAGRAGKYYHLVWGIDSLSVKLAESGEVVRFNYRVLDPDKARALGDKRSEPSLIDPRAGVRLVVPTMEKIGPLRQSSAPEAGKVYWMAFSNKGRPVKKGDRVDVVIGLFRAQGLVVD